MAVVFWIIVGGSLYAGYSHSISPSFFTGNIVTGGMLSSIIVVLGTYFLKHIFHHKRLEYMMNIGSIVLIGYGCFFSVKVIKSLSLLI